jgi:hypothetical protein
MGDDFSLEDHYDPYLLQKKDKVILMEEMKD